ncbi:hypothetical protein P0082_08345 [Candidatus Haliotispira prima]|uniref:Lipoprotein n=1 Tax=Candidatus Haliotispira prima TaxID=3034016 RepID=A0ABY8MET0_9SPIO|nr:hypothetical protein P0082_08345 [Candidatus Haliotispira prima]
MQDRQSIRFILSFQFSRFLLRLLLPAMFAGALLPSCTDITPSSYEVRNTIWEGTDPVSGDLIRIQFYIDALDVQHGKNTYASISTYNYNTGDFQGSISIEKFIYLDASVEDVIWLFTVAQNTNTLTAGIFSNSDKIRYQVLFTRQS